MVFKTIGTQQHFTKNLHPTNTNAELLRSIQGGAAMCIDKSCSHTVFITLGTQQNFTDNLHLHKYQCRPFSTTTRWCCNIFKQDERSEPLREQTISKHKKWSCHVEALTISEHKQWNCRVKALTAWALQLQSHNHMSTPPCLKQIRRLQHKDCTPSYTNCGNLLLMYTLPESWPDSKARTAHHADHARSSSLLNRKPLF